ncbi:M20 family metallopeptidase [Pseudonocardia xishanensis]|uniref:M20 family metallopeptidase n=1 Tax=Pseudonocardia xishanensis TaxID=630995 RepID=A0ABP8RQ55_9PSEU
MEKSAAVEQALASIDEDRVVSLVQDVCRIPSVLGDELAFAQYLVDVMKDSSFSDVRLQDVLPDRPNAIGELDFGAGPRVVLTGHMDTKPESIGWTDTTPYSGELIDGHVYGHGIMDMKAALLCQIVAAEAVRASGVPVSGRLGFAGVSDHMGDQLGSIRYFDEYTADLCVLGELSDNEIYLGHRGRYYFDITAQGKSAHTCHKPLAVNANMLAAKAILELDASRLTPELEPWVRDLFGEETYMAPGRVYGGLPPGGPSMIPDECVIRLDCRPQPGVSVETVRAELDRCLDAVKAADPRFAAQVELADVKSGYVADPQSLVVETMIDAVRRVRGTEPTLQAAGWLGDTASFGEQIPTVIFGPGGEPVYCPNERLSVSDIVEATKVYTAFATLALLK